MSYATMSKRALKSVREATTFELDELAERYEIVATHLRERLEEIDEILIRRIKYEHTHREGGERVHAGSKLPADGNTGDGSSEQTVDPKGLPDEGSTRGGTGRDTIKQGLSAEGKKLFKKSGPTIHLY